MSQPVDPYRKSARTILIQGRRTTIRIENIFWSLLDDISRMEGMSIGDLFAEIGTHRGTLGLTAAIRLFAVTYFRSVSTACRELTRERDGI